MILPPKIITVNKNNFFSKKKIKSHLKKKTKGKMKKCIGKHFLWYYLFSGKKKIIFSSTDENLVLSKMYKFSTVLF